jgi:hypothetical protein
MAILQPEEYENSDCFDSQGDPPQLFLTLSAAALSGVPAPKTLCLSASIQGHIICVLVDSGISRSFISTDLAAQLEGVVDIVSPLAVRVANVAKLACVSHFPQATWCVQKYEFNTDLKVLNLSSYDMILGMD